MIRTFKCYHAPNLGASDGPFAPPSARLCFLRLGWDTANLNKRSTSSRHTIALGSRMLNRTITNWFFAVFSLVALIWVVWFIIDMPPLRVAAEQDEVVIDVRTLGEYSTTVSRLTISSQEDGTILDLRSVSRTTQIGRFVLHSGHNDLNQIVVATGAFKRIHPSSGNGFTLRRGEYYRLRVWSGIASSSAPFAF